MSISEKQAHTATTNPKTSPTYDFFQIMFQSADTFSSVWQPMLKGVGRWHLEVANLGAKQGQATLQLSRDLARCWTAADVTAAYGRYWQAMTSQYTESSGRIAASVSQTVQSDVVSDVVAIPSKRSRDTMTIPDPAAFPDRKVA